MATRLFMNFVRIAVVRQPAESVVAWNAKCNPQTDWFCSIHNAPSRVQRRSFTLISGILNCVCPECGGRMGGPGQAFKCQGRCRRDWRQIRERILPVCKERSPRKNRGKSFLRCSSLWIQKKCQHSRQARADSAGLMVARKGKPSKSSGDSNAIIQAIQESVVCPRWTRHNVRSRFIGGASKTVHSRSWSQKPDLPGR